MKFIFIILSLGACAAMANEKGNGGDICEDRFKIVRDDIQSWITKGEAAGLKLPNGVSSSQYDKGMLDHIVKAKVDCGDENVVIGKASKTCKNFVEPDGGERIVCNLKKFLETSESDQYVLVHHEYAGLAGLEVNDGEDSKYSISNQLSEYLEDQTVKKLGVRGPALPPGFSKDSEIFKVGVHDSDPYYEDALCTAKWSAGSRRTCFSLDGSGLHLVQGKMTGKPDAKNYEEKGFRYITKWIGWAPTREKMITMMSYASAKRLWYVVIDIDNGTWYFGWDLGHLAKME